MLPCWTMTKDKAGPKSRHAAVTVGDRVYTFGGYSVYNMDQIDVHIFNTVALSWTKLPPVTTTAGEEQRPLVVPTRRRGHTATPIEDVIYIWGGVACKRRYCNVLYAFDVATHRWSKPNVSGTVPGARYSHSACVLGKVIYIYGGHAQLNGYTNDIYTLDIATMLWSSVNTRRTPPPVSVCHSGTIIGTKMFALGGYGYDHVYKDIRVFDTETNCWLSTPPAQLLPEGRKGHSAFAFNEELYIFGGDDFNSTFNDLWRFSPETFSWKKVEPQGKGPRWVTGSCCMLGDRILFFGVNTPDDLCILELSPSLKTLCKQAAVTPEVERPSGNEKVPD